MHVLKCKGTKYETTKKQQKHTHKKQPTPPPPKKNQINKKQKKNPNKTKQNPAINDLFYYNSLVLLHCFHRLYTFIFDMLTFFVGF